MWGDAWGTMAWGGGLPIPTMSPLGWTLLMGALVGAAWWSSTESHSRKNRALTSTTHEGANDEG